MSNNPQIRDLSQHPALPPPPADLPPEERDHLNRLVRGQREDQEPRAKQQQDQGVARQTCRDSHHFTQKSFLE